MILGAACWGERTGGKPGDPALTISMGCGFAGFARDCEYCIAHQCEKQVAACCSASPSYCGNNAVALGECVYPREGETNVRNPEPAACWVSFYEAKLDPVHAHDVACCVVRACSAVCANDGVPAIADRCL